MMKILKSSTYTKMEDELASLRKQNEEMKQKIVEIDSTSQIISSGASSIRDDQSTTLELLSSSLKILQPQFAFEVIETIRKLTIVNPDVNQAFNDVVRLANTGHKVIFDPSVGYNQIDEMREFILKSSKFWHVGSNGINGIVNKMFRQTLIGGANSVEWVPNLKLDNLEETRFINPETIRFVVDKNNYKYQPYQKLTKKFSLNKGKNMVKLNNYQFKYVALNGDTDLPYGIPPYISSLNGLGIQSKMVNNISFIVESLGVLGWVDAKLAKPNKNTGETDEAYAKRLMGILQEFKERVSKGLRDGVTAGFMGDHEFDFKQTAKTAQGAKDLFEQNELLIASGLNYDAAFLGRPGSTETLVTILFTKMIAQLKNIQDVVADNLEFGYTLALTLAGFKFNRLSIVFNKSTLADDLKFQQGLEIKVRNLEHLYDQGIIGQEQFADEMGYIKPDKADPRISREKVPAGDPLAKQNTKKKKDANAKKNRDKNKPQGTTRGPRSQKNSTIPSANYFIIG